MISNWIKRFFLVNAILWLLVCCCYFWLLPKFEFVTYITTRGEVTAWIFFITGLIGQVTLLALVPMLVLWLLARLIPWQKVWLVVSIIVASAFSLFIIADAIIYHLYHLHLAGVVFTVFSAGVAQNVFALSGVEWTLFIGLVVIIVLIEVAVAWSLWRRLVNRAAKSVWKIYVSGLACLFISYALFAEAITTNQSESIAWSNNHLILLEAQIIPYYENVLGWFLPEKDGLSHLETAGSGVFLQVGKPNHPLNYPKAPLVCHPHKKYNIVFIILDDWRYDNLTPKVTPNIYRFAQNQWQFKQHFSGGDCTGPGIFSLFYGIPYNYWTAAITQHVAPVLINILMREHYQMGVFRSASLHYPAFDRTVFYGVPNLRITTPGKNAVQRDQYINHEFMHFMATYNKKKPFFAFLFYDKSHNYCGKGNYPRPFQPEVKECDRLALDAHTNPLPMRNRQRNAILFDDKLAGKVLDKLKAEHLLKNTVVIITADHGEEFNDNGLGYWGHASDFSVYQTHVPMIIHMPGQLAHQFYHQTTHYDVAPFLLKDVLNCSTLVSDYSVGFPIENPQQRDFFIINSYMDYGIITPKHITRIYAQGNYSIKNRRGIPQPNARLNLSVMKQVIDQLNTYYKKK